MQVDTCSFGYELTTDCERRDPVQDNLDAATSVGLELQTFKPELGRTTQPRGCLSAVAEASKHSVDFAVAACRLGTLGLAWKVRRAPAQDDEWVCDRGAAGDRPRRDARPQSREVASGLR